MTIFQKLKKQKRKNKNKMKPAGIDMSQKQILTPQREHEMFPLLIPQTFHQDYYTIDVEEKAEKKEGFIIPAFVMLFLLAFLAMCLIIVTGHTDGLSIESTVVDHVRQYKVVRGQNHITLAEGSFEMSSDRSGWHHLHVVGKRTETADEYFRVMDAVGYLEGYATCPQIMQFYSNFYSGLFDGADPTVEVVTFLLANFEWMNHEAEKHWKRSSYWLGIKGLTIQMKGMLNGFRAGCPQWQAETKTRKDQLPYLASLFEDPSLIHLLILNANGDLYQIASKFEQNKAPPSIFDDGLNDIFDQAPPNVGNLTIDDDGGTEHDVSLFFNSQPPQSYRRERQQQLQKMFSTIKANNKEKIFLKDAQDGFELSTNSVISVAKESTTSTSRGSNDFAFNSNGGVGISHCSVLIKLLEDGSDLLFAHNTWDDFQSMAPRIFKHYSLPNPVYKRELKRSASYASAAGQVENQGTVESGSGDDDGDGDGDGNELVIDHVELDFSSSPGFLTSVDDFFVVSGLADLAVMETRSVHEHE